MRKCGWAIKALRLIGEAYRGRLSHGSGRGAQVFGLWPGGGPARRLLLLPRLPAARVASAAPARTATALCRLRRGVLGPEGCSVLFGRLPVSRLSGAEGGQGGDDQEGCRPRRLPDWLTRVQAVTVRRWRPVGLARLWDSAAAADAAPGPAVRTGRARRFDPSPSSADAAGPLQTRDRAMIRAGELMLEIKAQRAGRPSKIRSRMGPNLRKQAAADAGLTPKQAKTAAFVADRNERRKGDGLRHAVPGCADRERAWGDEGEKVPNSVGQL
jgi:hypothetical protein